MVPSKEVVLTKMSGTGNDFLIANLLHKPEPLAAYFPQKTLSEITQTICNRHHHLGADGAIFIRPSEKNSHFAWQFFNSDGSVAEMCGNAARCVTLYAFTHHLAPRNLVFDSMVGPIHGEVLDNNKVRVTMPALKKPSWGESLQINGKNVKYDFLDMGVPHVVHQIPSYCVDENLWALAKSLRQHPHFRPQGANITFYFVEKTCQLHTITFERGVENWTLSCGTGAVAAASSHCYWSESPGPVEVHLPGGLLTVKLNEKWPQLIGPVKLIADIQLYK